MNPWKPKEIIINEAVVEDPVTKYFLKKCPRVPVKYVSSGSSKIVKKASDIMRKAGDSKIEMILAGKEVVYIAPFADDVVDTCTMVDPQFACPHFDRLKLANNGCFFSCNWCYLKMTYRGVYPFITIRAEYPKIKKRLAKRLNMTPGPVMFNSGEMADSLSMEHLTRAGQEFIPWFGNSGNGYLFMLTKSANVDPILNLAHNNHTILAWSLNAPEVSRQFEIGAPIFAKRLVAAEKAQKAGYRVRVRLDPILPIPGWKQAYAETIDAIFQLLDPERITLGTLRFEQGFYNLRNTLFTTGPDLAEMVAEMKPMFKPKTFPGSPIPKVGKYSFPRSQRIEVFGFAIEQIRKYSKVPIALCKESRSVWEAVGLNLAKCQCVCQLDYADMSKRKASD